MFTGIVEETGRLVSARQLKTGYELTVAAATVLEGTRLGDSISVEGVCLTVTALAKDTFTVSLAPETLARTTLGAYRPGHPLNLERALTPTSRLGGHFVQGHVDGTGTLAERRVDRDALWLTIRVDPALMRWIVPKGFVALDGISLTVVETGRDWFTVMLVSYTQTHVTLPARQVGQPVNIETDLLGKYVDRLLSTDTDRGRPAPASLRLFHD